MSNNCHECGGRFNPQDEYLGHQYWCDEEEKENNWLNGQLSQLEVDLEYVVIYWSDGRPNAVPKEDLGYWLLNGWKENPPVVLG